MHYPPETLFIHHGLIDVKLSILAHDQKISQTDRKVTVVEFEKSTESLRKGFTVPFM